jgi:hypothetical protein
MMRAAAGGPAVAQDAFHHHQWPGRGELSVLMSRADARTVSITTVEIGERRVWMEYLAAGFVSVGRPVCSRRAMALVASASGGRR